MKKNNTEYSQLVLEVRRQLQRGLPLVERPYQALADKLGVCEATVLKTVEQLRQEGLIKRLGLVVRHHELGYVHNGMVVWNIPEECVDDVGKTLAKEAKVTLCYQRPRRLGWPYNLFCMIHGKSREQVRKILMDIRNKNQLHYEHDILFSVQRFKQQGGRYVD